MNQPTYITQSETTIAGDIFKGIEALKAEVKQMQTGYAAARLEIESLKAQLKAVSKQKNESWCKDCTPDNCSGCCTSGGEPTQHSQNDAPEAMTEEKLVELENTLLDVAATIYNENPIRAIQVAAVTLATMVHLVSKDQNLDPTVPVEISGGGGCVVEVWGAMTMGT